MSSGWETTVWIGVLFGFLFPLPIVRLHDRISNRARRIRRARKLIDRAIRQIGDAEIGTIRARPTRRERAFVASFLWLSAVAQSYKPKHDMLQRKFLVGMALQARAPGAHYGKVATRPALLAKAVLPESAAVRVVALLDGASKSVLAWRRYHEDHGRLRQRGIRTMRSAAAFLTIPAVLLCAAGRRDEAAANLVSMSTWLTVAVGVRLGARALVRLGLLAASTMCLGMAVVFNGWNHLDGWERVGLRGGLVACGIGALVACVGVGESSTSFERLGALLVAVGLAVLASFTLLDGWRGNLDGFTVDAYSGLSAGLGELCMVGVAFRIAFLGRSRRWRLWDNGEDLAPAVRR